MAFFNDDNDYEVLDVLSYYISNNEFIRYTPGLTNFQNDSALDLADMDPGDQAVLDMADHPPAPTTAASDGLESAITIYTPGVLGYSHMRVDFTSL